MSIQDELATEHFEWFLRTIKARYGPQMEEHAGPAFMRVLKQFDPAKGTFRAFASKALDFAVKSEYAQDHGRSTSKKRKAELSSTDIDDESCDSEVYDGGLIDLLRSIDREHSSIVAKSVAVCQVLGLFDDGDTAFIVGRRSLRGVVLRPTNS
jgi:hypothetical protein